MKRIVIAILLAALILFGASYGLQGIAAKNAREEHLWLMQTLLPGSETFTVEPYSGEDANIRAVHKAENGLTIHQKAGIGRLSAYCGAISAGCGAGAGIAYLNGGNAHAIAHTVVNAIAILSGTICDGAKPSCAAKIASAVEAGILGYHMYLEGQQFYSGDGIVTKGADNTVYNIGKLAREGMRETDRTILEIMLSND